MARRATVAWTPAFINMELLSGKFHEANDCGVKCLALIAGISYEDARTHLANLGRKHRGPTMWWSMWKAVADYGLLVEDCLREISDRIPARSDGSRRALTSYSNQRFPGIFRPEEKFILCTNDHVLAVTDGVVQDWSIGRSLRINRCVRVTKAP